MLASKHDRAPAANQSPGTITVDGKRYQQIDINMNIVYNVHQTRRSNDGSLVDRGSNGGLAGNDTRVIAFHPHRKVDIQGIDNHRLNDVRVADVGAVVNTPQGEILVILPQYAYTGKGATIHSSGQLEWYGSHVDDKSIKVGGTQCITTPHGLKIPLDIVNGLARLPMRPYTDKEWEDLPHVFLGLPDIEWDPRVLDSRLTDDQEWLSSQEPPADWPPNPNFDIVGDYTRRTHHTSVNTSQSWTWNPWEDNPFLDDESVYFATDNDASDDVDDVPALYDGPYSDSDSDDDSSAQSDDSSAQVTHKHESYTTTTETDDDMSLESYVDHIVNDNYIRRIHADYHELEIEFTDDDISVDEDLPFFDAHQHEFDFHDDLIFFDANPHEFEPPVASPDGETGDTDDPPQQTTSNPRTTKKSPRDWNALRPLFGWLRPDVIKRTFELTTQYARMPNSEILKKHYRSPNPAVNVHRRNEDLATDTVFSDTPAVDGGHTAAQFYVGLSTHVVDIYPLKSESQFVNSLEDVIRERGAPNRLVSDSANVETKGRALDILRALYIGNWQSEPHQQHQNPAERRFQTVKNTANVILDRTGAPPNTWLLCLLYVCFLLNHTFCAAVNGIPMQHLTGQTSDISPLLRFHFWEEVYYKLDDSDFPSESRELKGNIVGIAEHVGHLMTYKVLTQDTNTVIYRSNLRPVLPGTRNKRLDLLSGEDLKLPDNPVIKARKDIPPEPGEQASEDAKPSDTPVFVPTDLIGRTFLLEPREDGQRFRARIVQAITDHEANVEREADRIKFKCSINNDEFEELLTYNEVLEHIQRDEQTSIAWKFKRIVAHQGPLKESHPDYNGSKYNVEIEWENGEITKEPLNVIAADDPVTCAIYAKENNLLEKEGWRRFRSIARRHKKYFRMVNQAKLRSYNSSPKYMFGYEIPKNYQHALELDARNGNTKWRDCTALEMQQLNEYKTFKDLGHASTVRVPSGYKKIRVHLVYAVKHDGRHKARLVADGHLTDVPMESVYSGVVSLRGFRLVIFLAELNGLKAWSTDIGNAYLEARTKEKLVIIGGAEFGELAGHLLQIDKALYGLRTSGLRWHERFAECLRSLGFFPCRAEPDIWMRENDGLYEYIAVYVDDLAMAMRDPEAFVQLLQEKFKFKLKGTGPISYHLGMNFYREKDGTLAMAPKQYIDRMIDSYQRLFGESPKQSYHSPIEKGDHPELDTSEFLDQEGISQYQSLIGILQWVITIGRFDVQTAVMTLSSFRVAPRRGHIERAKRIFGYLSKMRHGAIRVRTDIPDYSELPDQSFDWKSSVYGDPKEIVPEDAPPPLGKPVLTTTYVDANLMHDILTGRSVTGVLHFVNQTPFDWYSKKQSTVETATYGSEFVAARTAVEQIIDHRNTLRYLGVPLKGSYLFGDNQSVVNSSTIPHSKLHKRHTMLSFHRVREAVASSILEFHYIPGSSNPADILSKHWGYSQIWELLRPILFWNNELDGTKPEFTDNQD